MGVPAAMVCVGMIRCHNLTGLHAEGMAPCVHLLICLYSTLSEACSWPMLSIRKATPNVNWAMYDVPLQGLNNVITKCPGHTG